MPPYGHFFFAIFAGAKELKESYDNFDWILNPFVVAQTDLSGREEEELAELSSDRTLMISVNQKALASFWLSVLDEYHCAHKRQQKFYYFLPLPTCVRQHFLLSPI